MNSSPSLRTPRLILRPWRETDLKPFAALNADPKVMECFVSTLSEQESNHLAAKIIEEFKHRNYGLWAVEILGIANFIGFIGLHSVTFEAHFTPCVEIGWRIAADYWGQGYAYEGARAALRYGFETLGLKEIVSFTTVGNYRSRRLMERLGMKRDIQGDFEHPRVPLGHPIRPHVLYRLTYDEWVSKEADAIRKK